MARLSILLTVALGSFAVALPALGHASLVETTPADGSRLDASPASVEVVFDEDVDVPVAAIRVFDASGTRVDGGDAAHGVDRRVIEVSLPPLDDGAYVVTWRAVSLDGHPIRGAFVFSIGEGTVALDDDLVAALLGEEGDRAVSVVGAVLRFLTYAAALVAAGATVFAIIVAGAYEGATPALVRRAAAVGIITSFLQVPVFAIESTGLGLAALASWPAISAAAASSLGIAAMIRVFALVLLALASRRPPAWIGYVGLALVVLADVFTGHTRTTDPMWVTIGSDAIHVAAASVWVGGLATLAGALRSSDDPGVRARLVGGFSALAAWSVAALALAGMVLAWTQVRTFAALTSTGYGWTLLAKLAAVLVVVLMAVYNNRVLVPLITAPTAASDPDAPSHTARLARTIRAELVGLAVVLGVTAFLVNVQPAAQAAGASGPYSTYVAFGDDQLNLVVDPNRAGVNEIHLYVLTPGGLPALASGDAEIELRLPAEEIGPIVRRLQVAGSGHYLHAGPELAIPGEWVITVRERISAFDVRSVEVPVTVNR
ncbi:MAG TPA: copper resistance protein CopC [Acidimicrobiia bacterium]|nr:copper resistance protein CopC [Acidimicrobiia bacterium]